MQNVISPNKQTRKMTLQWTLIVFFLYFEIAIVTALLLPTIRPSFWNRLFHSRLSKAAKKYMYLAHIVVVFMALLFFDAMREIYKYQAQVSETEAHPNAPLADVQVHMKLFRSQRNMYIAGFTITMWFVMHRLVQVTVSQARMEIDNQVLLKQAEGASKIARETLEAAASTGGAGKAGGDAGSEVKRLLAAKDTQIGELNKQLEVMECDLEALRKQAKGLTNEYDRLLKEHEQLQKTISRSGSKKDE